MCRRMLKAWIVFGASVDTKDDHLHLVWPNIVKMAKEDGIPDENELDFNMPESWQAWESPRRVQDQDVTRQLQQGAPVGRRRQHSLLGDPLPGTPEAVHAEMEQLAAQGLVPITTPVQRARQNFTPGSEYGVPAFFAEARRWGYISPNLPPPRGLYWRCRGSEWNLCIKGG